MSAIWSLSFAGGGDAKTFRTDRFPGVGETIHLDGHPLVVTSIELGGDDRPSEVWAARSGFGEPVFETVRFVEFVDAATRKPVRRIISTAVPPSGLLVEGPENPEGSFDLYRTTGAVMLESDGIGGSIFRVLVVPASQSELDAVFGAEAGGC